MSQVFVSYARADKHRVAKLVSALRKSGFEPWWDDDIPPGASWEQTIEKALAEAASVIVCWSPAGVASENVRSEARIARSRGRLVQVFFEPCEPPLFFSERQGIDLVRWNGSTRDPRFKRLAQALRPAMAPELHEGLPVAPEKRLRSPIPAKVTAIAGAITVIALASWWWQHSTPAQAASRIAVMPVEGLGGQPAVASLAGGLTDQITTILNDGHIPTVSRTDSESLTGPDADQRFKSLGVGYSFNGTVEKAGNTLHARLHFDDRARHVGLWSYEMSGPADDPIAFNYAVARSVVGVVSCAYRALVPGGLTDTDLLSRYLRVCDLFVNHADATDTKATFELLDDLRLITAGAPKFAPAHSDLAKFGAYLAPLLPADQAARVRAESGRESARALALDPHSADAWLAREMALRPTDWARREALLRKAVAVNPQWPHSNGFLAMFLAETGRMSESATYAQRAAAADLQIDWVPAGAELACDGGATNTTIDDLRQRLSISPGDPDIKWALRWCLLDSGQFREAKTLETSVPTGTVSTAAFRQAVENALISGQPYDRAKAQQLGARLAANDPALLTFIIPWTAALGELDTAFRLAQQFSPGYPVTGITNFLFSPQTESMRRDPRFFALAKRYGLADFWRSTGRWPDFCAGPKLQMCKAATTAQMPPSTGS